METKKIRIGNDIRLAVDLRLYIGGNYLKEREVYNPEAVDFENIDSNPFVNKKYEVYYQEHGELDPNETPITYTTSSIPVCIRSVKAVLVNTTRLEQIAKDLLNKNRFISRFPIEPMFDAFHSTPYDLCNSGYPTWRTYPIYNGFGVNPRFEGLKKRLAITNDTEYHASVAATNMLNVVEVIFPAEHQLHVGKYKLIIVAKLYAPGFNRSNLKTVTLDVPDVFELVSTTEEGVDTSFDIHVTRTLDKLPEPLGDNIVIKDIYVDNGYVNSDDDLLSLNRSDNSVVDIDLSSIASWYDGD